MSHFDRIEKLTSNNYDTWSIIIESVLKSKKLWTMMFQEPINDKAPSDDDIAKDEEAKSIIYSSMSREEIQKSGISESAGDLWLKIKENHEGADVDQRNLALSDFMLFSYRKGEHLTSYCGRFELALSKAESTGVVMDESMKFHIFRNNLPKDLKMMANFWLMANPEGRISSLMTSLKLQHHIDQQDTSSAAFYGNVKSNTNEKSNIDLPSKQKKFCKYCRKKGHSINECNKKASKDKAEANTSKCQENFAKRGAFSVLDHTIRNQYDWIIDSGASWHMTPNKSLLTNYTQLDQPKSITIGDGKELLAIGKGKYSFHSGRYEGDLFDVMFVPGLSENLLSVGHAMAKGNEIEFSNDEVLFKQNSITRLKGRKILGNLFVVELKPSKSTHFATEHSNNFSSSQANPSIDEWHKRFGHTSIENVKAIARSNAVDGLKIDNKNAENCLDCIKGKITRAQHPVRSTIKADENSAVLYIDTCGPFNPESLGKSRYFVLAVEDWSNYKLISFVSSKSEIADVVKRMINKVELESKRSVKLINTDNGSEFMNSSLRIFLLDKGILHETTAVYTPEQNGVVERANRVILEGIKTLLSDSNLTDKLWAEAANCIVYTTNRVFGPRSNTKTRFELYFGCKPNVSNLRAFGCQALIHIPKAKRNQKLSDKGKHVKFVGYTDRMNTYRFYDDERESVVISCDAKFIAQTNEQSKEIETEFITFFDVKSQNDKQNNIVDSHEPDFYDFTDASIEDDQAELTSAMMDNNSASSQLNDRGPTMNAVSCNDANSSQNASDQSSMQLDGDKSPDGASQIESRNDQIPKRSTRSNTNSDELIRPNNCPSWFYNPTNYFAHLSIDNEPTTLTEAMNSDDWHHWSKAMDEEIAALDKNKTWLLVPRPKDRKIIKSKWVFKLKHDANGNIERFKARLVAKGYSQIPDIDYKETFAPVASATTIRTLFAIATQNQMELLQFDIKTAFLNGDLNEELYIEPPPGMIKDNNVVCKLVKSLYGLKQAPRQWNIKFDEFLLKFNLTRSSNDKCLYYNKNRSLILVIYVDDGLAASCNKSLLTALMDHLKSAFEVKTMPCESYLGFKITRENEDLVINQRHYVAKILSRFGMNDCKPCSTPEEVGPQQSVDMKQLPPNYPFKDLVGSLLYLVTLTRPDLAHAVSIASRTANPTMDHWHRLKRILRYLKGTDNLGIRFRREKAPRLVAYSDADYANDASRRSTTGWVVMYANSPIAWRCQRQSIITLSTTEAEYVSGCDLVKELLPIRESLIELQAIKSEATVVKIDNLSTVRIANDDGGQKRTKHIDIRSKWLNEQSSKDKIRVCHVRGDQQLADILTKPLHRTKFESNRKLLLTSFTLMCILSIVNAKNLLKIEPLDFELSKHLYVHKPEVWNVELMLPNPCPIYFDIAETSNHPYRSRCEQEYARVITVFTSCRGLVNNLNIHMTPKIVYPVRSHHQDYARPYFMGLKGQFVDILTESINDMHGDANRIQAKNQSKNNIKRYFKSMMNIDPLSLGNEYNSSDSRSNIDNSSNQKQVWQQIDTRVDNYRYLFHEYNKTLTAMNIQSISGKLKADFPIWMDHAISSEPSAKWAHMFNCTRFDGADGSSFNLSYVAPKVDPNIEFYSAVWFDFYNTTRVESINRTNLCWMAYHGPKYVMVNKTNNCMNEVAPSMLSDDTVAVPTCEKPSTNLKEYALHMWHKEYCTNNIIPMKSNVQIKHFNGLTRIYCYPYNVTLDNELHQCPDYVFETDSNTVYKVADLELVNSHELQKINATQLHLLKDLRSMLKIDEIHLGAKKIVNNIESVITGGTNTVSSFIRDIPSGLTNVTSSVTNTISESANTVRTKIMSRFDESMKIIWQYIEWAGILLSVIAAGFLLILAAPIFEVMFVGVRLFKVPYRYMVASVTRILGNFNSRAMQKTARYVNKAKNHLNLQRSRLRSDRYQLTKMV